MGSRQNKENSTELPSQHSPRPIENFREKTVISSESYSRIKETSYCENS